MDQTNTTNTTSTTTAYYTNYCPHKLPCGMCKLTYNICLKPGWNSDHPIPGYPWTITTCTTANNK